MFKSRTRRMSRWTEHEVEVLREKWPTERTEDIPLSRSVYAIERKAGRLGLERVPDFKVRNRIKDRSSAQFDPDDGYGHFLSGFIAGEGSFMSKERDSRGMKFALRVEVVEDDQDIIEGMKEYLGVGTVRSHEKRDDKWQRTVSFSVQGVVDHLLVTIPFVETYGLRDTLKQSQYQSWKASVLDQYNVNDLVKW